jgi:hypothetical protein
MIAASVAPELLSGDRPKRVSINRMTASQSARDEPRLDSFVVEVRLRAS